VQVSSLCRSHMDTVYPLAWRVQKVMGLWEWPWLKFSCETNISFLSLWPDDLTWLDRDSSRQVSSSSKLLSSFLACGWQRPKVTVYIWTDSFTMNAGLLSDTGTTQVQLEWLRFMLWWVHSQALPNPQASQTFFWRSNPIKLLTSCLLKAFFLNHQDIFP